MALNVVSVTKADSYSSEYGCGSGIDKLIKCETCQVEKKAEKATKTA